MYLFVTVHQRESFFTTDKCFQTNSHKQLPLATD